jgi:superkiller protein 3
LLGLSAYARRRLTEAEEHVRRALTLAPREAAAHDNLSLILAALGRPVEAEAAARQALALQPTLAGAAHNLGLALRAQGRFVEAETALRQAVGLAASDADAWNNLAAVLEPLGRLPEAVAALERAVQLRPDFRVARENLRRLRSALPAPRLTAAEENNRGVQLLAQRRFAEAEAAFRQALLLEGNPPIEVSYNLAKSLQAQDRLQQAEALYLHVASRRPDWGDCHYSLGNLYFAQRRLSNAEAAYRRAANADPGDAEALNNLGANVLNNEGRIDEARAVYREALARKPDHALCHSNFLLNEHYAPGVTLAGLAEVHADWQRRHAAPLRSTWRPFPNTRDPDRPLRLGFASGDFFYHPVGVFLAPVLERLDRKQWFTVCYANQRREDDQTRRQGPAGGEWRKLAGH